MECDIPWGEPFDYDAAWVPPPDPIPPGYRVPANKIFLAERLRRDLRALGVDGNSKTFGLQRQFIAAVEKALQQQQQQEQLQ